MLFINWLEDIERPLYIILGRDYRDRLPNFAIKYPPEDGLSMSLINIDDIEMDEVILGRKRSRNNNISLDMEIHIRQKYNHDINVGSSRIKKYVGIIKSAYIKYVSYHGIYPINSVPNKSSYCLKCYKHFNSRNKLFKHLKKSNHFYEIDINKLVL
jgi:hypothetical protein